MSRPQLLDSALYALLHKDDIAGFNQERPQGPIEGASLAHAQISGAYFPVEVTADEILMSVNFGTRLRYRTK